MGPLLPALLALLLSAPAFAAPIPFGFPWDEPLDPYYAQNYLKDARAQQANKAADPDEAAKVLERAAAIKDMSDILISYVDPAAMNEALRVRLLDDDANADGPKLLGFGAHPASLLAWRAKYFDYVPSGRLEMALWEWDTLTPQQHDFLAAAPRSFDKAKWEATAFPRRLAALHEWASAIYDKMMKSSPKTAGELQAMQNERYMIWGVMDGTQKRLSGEYMTKAGAAVAGLGQLDKLPPSVRESSDPAMKDLLAKARSGASPQETLAALSALFEKAGVHNADVQMQSPDRPDQKLASVDPKLFADMLATGLKAEIGDVDAGRAVDKFFETHPLKIAAQDLATNLAQYQPWNGSIVFNERFITDWIKSQGLSAQAVISDPARFHELVMILAPNFVHESTHQMQKAFADDHGIYAWNAQHQEIEAKEVQSDYMIEKMAKDPSYGEFLKRNRAGSYIVQQDLQQTAGFMRSPRAFHAIVMSDYYAGLPSLENVESSTLVFLNTNIDALRAEKARRAGLSPAIRDGLELFGNDKDADFKTMPEWKAYLQKVKGSVLDALIAKDTAEREKVIKTYDLTSARETQVDEHIESDAEKVIQGQAPAPDHEVPPPGKPR